MRRRIDITANPEHRNLGLVKRRVADRMTLIKLRNLTDKIRMELVVRRIQNFTNKAKVTTSERTFS